MTGTEGTGSPGSPPGSPTAAPNLVLATASDDYPVNMEALRQGLAGAAIARTIALPRGPMSLAEEDAAALLLAQADGILVRVGYVGPRLVAMLPRLRVVTLHGSGVDQVAVEACLSRGVTVTNTPGANSGAVAELTIGLMLTVLRRIALADARLRAGDWAAGRVPAEELAGKVVGVVGHGRIGQRVADLARAFDARVIVHTRTPRPGEACVSFDDLLVASDIVTLHVPLTSDTAGMLHARRIARMKNGAILVNTSRGALVDEGALTVALAAGRLGGAGLDVFSLEPPDPNDPLLRLPSVVVTPHMGSSTREALAAIARMAGEDMARVLGGQPALHPVTAET